MKPLTITIPLALAATLLGAPAAQAVPLSDEIQVYMDEINRPGERSVELHVNTTLKGRREPDFPGAVASHHGLRITPEISQGLSEDTDAALYLPALRDAAGNWYLAGAKLRLKWLPVRGDEAHGGWFVGANGEIGNIGKRFSESRVSTELRLVAGYRSEAWQFGINPIFGWDLSPGQRENNPQFDLAWKIARATAPGIGLGLEYYQGYGKPGNFLPKALADRTLYLALDFDRKPWVFNLGIGRGLTEATDAWTIKAIFHLDFE
jgi:hypothetical protein